MKLNKQYILLIIILSISAGAFLLFPSFEREDFDTDIVEDISSGTISTTTTLNDESKNSIEEGYLKYIGWYKKFWETMK